MPWSTAVCACAGHSSWQYIDSQVWCLCEVDVSQRNTVYKYNVCVCGRVTDYQVFTRRSTHHHCRRCSTVHVVRLDMAPGYAYTNIEYVSVRTYPSTIVCTQGRIQKYGLGVREGVESRPRPSPRLPSPTRPFPSPPRSPTLAVPSPPLRSRPP